MHKKLRVISVAHVGTLFKELLKTYSMGPCSQVLVAPERNLLADYAEPEILSLVQRDVLLLEAYFKGGKEFGITFK